MNHTRVERRRGRRAVEIEVLLACLLVLLVQQFQHLLLGLVRRLELVPFLDDELVLATAPGAHRPLDDALDWCRRRAMRARTGCARHCQRAEMGRGAGLRNGQGNPPG